MGSGRWSRGKHSAQFVQHPWFRGIQSLQMLLRSSCLFQSFVVSLLPLYPATITHHDYRSRGWDRLRQDGEEECPRHVLWWWWWLATGKRSEQFSIEILEGANLSQLVNLPPCLQNILGRLSFPAGYVNWLDWGILPHAQNVLGKFPHNIMTQVNIDLKILRWFLCNWIQWTASN